MRDEAAVLALYREIDRGVTEKYRSHVFSMADRARSGRKTSVTRCWGTVGEGVREDAACCTGMAGLRDGGDIACHGPS